MLISSIKECYIVMINSTDKISMRVSCSMVVIFIVFSQVDVIELWHKLVWLFDVLDSGNLMFVFSKGSNSVASSWPYMNFNFFCDVSSGVGLCPYMGNGCVYYLIWVPPSLLGFLSWLKCPLPYYSYCQIVYN